MASALVVVPGPVSFSLISLVLSTFQLATPTHKTELYRVRRSLIPRGDVRCIRVIN
jgi:hypothetical protein